MIVSLSDDVEKLKRQLTAKEKEFTKVLKMKEGNIDNITSVYCGYTVKINFVNLTMLIVIFIVSGNRE